MVEFAEKYLSSLKRVLKKRGGQWFFRGSLQWSWCTTTI